MCVCMQIERSGKTFTGNVQGIGCTRSKRFACAAAPADV
jgi:hypothetical protein